MTAIDESWDFLRDFYQSDKSIVNLINKAVGTYSNKSLRDTSFEIFLNDLISLFTEEVEGVWYDDLLDYFIDLDDETVNKDQWNIENQENTFLTNAETPLLTNTFNTISLVAFIFNFAYKRLHKANGKYQSLSYTANIYAILKQLPEDKKPYCFLFVHGLNENWFLYNDNSRKLFPNNESELLFRFLKKRFERSQRKKKNPSRWKRFKKRFSKDSQSTLSTDQLYPLMTLLIVLRREWEESKTAFYVNKKISSLVESYKNKKEVLNDALIYGLYREFDAHDQAIIDVFDTKIPQVKFHPLIARHIIESQSYKILFEMAYYENSARKRKLTDEWYKYIKEKLDKEEFNGNRLLLDYWFPYTEVRDHDVFKPHENEWSLTDRIYISLIKGEEYLQYWREPDNHERFDYIQIEPVRNISGDIEDNRVVFYQKYLSPTGDFLVVKSKEDYELGYRIEKEFSHFRHDLKAIRFNLSIEINRLQRKWDSNDVEKQKERIDRIKDYYSMLNAFIDMAGNPKTTEENNNIEIVDFLRRYTQFIAMARNSGTIQYNVNDSAVPEDYTIYFNKALLTVILDAIVDNAIKHGFNDYHDCATPTIEFELVDTEQYLLLKVCNNGRPIDITNADFKTRGVFAGPTGHTGLGGYLINKHMIQQDGKVELPLPEERTWNTEIHLYIKKDGSKE